MKNQTESPALKHLEAIEQLYDDLSYLMFSIGSIMNKYSDTPKDSGLTYPVSPIISNKSDFVEATFIATTFLYLCKKYFDNLHDHWKKFCEILLEQGLEKGTVEIREPTVKIEDIPPERR